MLVDHCLLRETTGGYHLHDMVLEFLRLAIGMDTDTRALAIKRQAHYLSTPEVLHAFAGDDERSEDRLHSLVRLWNALATLDNKVDVQEHYLKSLAELDERDSTAWREAGRLLRLLVRFAFENNATVARAR